MDKFYLFCFYAFKFIIIFTPNTFHSVVAKSLAQIYFKLGKKRLHTVMTNLNLAFGDEKTQDEKMQIAQKCYVQFAKFLGINFIKNQNISKEELLKKVRFTNENYIQDAINSNRPIIVTTAHYGDWEIFPLAVAAKFKPASVVGRKIDSPGINAIVGKNRTKFDIELIDKSGGARAIIKAAKGGRIIGMVVDQNTAKSDGIEVKFFNKRALHTPAASIIAQKINAIIIPGFIRCDDEKGYEICFFEPIDISKMPKEEAVQIATQLQTDAEETIIRSKPDEYFWFHKRFKHFYEKEYEC
ncbi:MAG: lipid A biosynthesis lauroyl acyltransferase [Campylobacter sp.]